MPLYFESSIKGIHYEKNNSFKALCSRILKDVRGFSKIIISSADFGLMMPRVDKYYLHFPFLLTISLILSILRFQFVSLFFIAIILEIIFIKDIWFLRRYSFREKILAIVYSLCVAFLKIFFIPIFIFKPIKLFINEKIKAVVIDKSKNKINKNYRFRNSQPAKSYISTVINRIYYMLKLFSKWEIMKIITVIRLKTN